MRTDDVALRSAEGVSGRAAARSHPGAPSPARTDVLVVGQLFLDVVFAGLPGAPRLGEEQWTADFGWGPGGIANMAIAAARLGASTAISAFAGDDPLSDLCRRRLELEGLDVSALRTVPGWSLPVTASLGFDGDRALVTGGTPAPSRLADLVAVDTSTRTAIVHIDRSTDDVVRRLADSGTKVFADLGWDGTGTWDPALLEGLDSCYAFAPNHVECMALTRTDTADDALSALSAHVQLSVVTLGARGALALDRVTGERVHVEPVAVTAVDATGAGDVFIGALAVATLTDWTLHERIEFAALTAAITVSRSGGAATAPTQAGILQWLDQSPAADRTERFAFIREAFASAVPSLPALPWERPKKEKEER